MWQDHHIQRYNRRRCGELQRFGHESRRRQCARPAHPPARGNVQPSQGLPATLEVVDIPGLKAGSTTDDGRSIKLLGHIKNVDAMLHVVRCFEDDNIPFEYSTIDPERDVATVDLELMVADIQTLQNKVKRLSKRARGGDKDAIREVADCEKVIASLEDGTRPQADPERGKLASVRECHLLSLKSVLYIANIKSMDDAGNSHVKALKAIADAEGSEMVLSAAGTKLRSASLNPPNSMSSWRRLVSGSHPWSVCSTPDTACWGW